LDIRTNIEDLNTRNLGRYDIMPYRKFRRGGKYCMQNKETGKTYCYTSAAARIKGMKMHEAFKHGWVPTRLGSAIWKKGV